MEKLKETTETSYSSRFYLSFEIVLIYIASGLIILTFFDSIKKLLYGSLGYIALFMFLTVFVLMVILTVLNFYRGLKKLLKK